MEGMIQTLSDFTAHEGNAAADWLWLNTWSASQLSVSVQGIRDTWSIFFENLTVSHRVSVNNYERYGPECQIGFPKRKFTVGSEIQSQHHISTVKYVGIWFDVSSGKLGTGRHINRQAWVHNSVITLFPFGITLRSYISHFFALIYVFSTPSKPWFFISAILLSNHIKQRQGGNKIRANEREWERERGKPRKWTAIMIKMEEKQGAKQKQPKAWRVVNRPL